MNWLHFIGRKYYTQKKFIKEAKRYGATRRIDLRVMKKMNWNDKVFCTMLKGKSSVLFGYFNIEKVSGLSPSANEIITNRFEGELISGSGGVVIRGCGSYVSGACYAVRATLPEIAELLIRLKKAGVDIGKPMIGGPFFEIERIRLKDIPFRQGFREFDWEKCRNSANNGTAHGQLYVVRGEEIGAPSDSGEIEEVRKYKRFEEQQVMQLLLF